MVTDWMVWHQAGVKPAVAEQQMFLIGPGGKELGEWTRRCLTDTLDSKDVKSLHLITHCFEFCLGIGPDVVLGAPSRGGTGHVRLDLALKLWFVSRLDLMRSR